MVGVYLAIAVGAVILVAFAVDNIPQELYRRPTNLRAEILDLTVATLKHLKHPYMLSIIPLTLYSGFEQAAFNAEFSKVSATSTLIRANPLCRPYQLGVCMCICVYDLWSVCCWLIYPLYVITL